MQNQHPTTSAQQILTGRLTHRALVVATALVVLPVSGAIVLMSLLF